MQYFCPPKLLCSRKIMEREEHVPKYNSGDPDCAHHFKEVYFMSFDKYVRPKPGCAILVAAFFAMFPLVLTYEMIFHPEGITDWKMAVMADAGSLIVVLVIFYILYVKHALEYNSLKNELSRRGLLMLADANFNNAESFFDDALRAGGSFLFGRNTGAVVPILDIKYITPVKTTYSGQRTGSDYSYFITVEPRRDVFVAKSDTFREYEWERLIYKLQSINPGIVVNELETRHVHVSHSSD